jgi:prepilin peptidase CpaA
MMSAIWATFTILFLLAAVWDARTYRIPNWISLALVALFVVAAAVSGQPVISFWPHLAASAGVFALGYGLYALTGMGAGDAKLGTAAAMWAGFSGLYAWAFALALAMSLLAFALILLRRVLPAGKTPGPKVFQKGAPVPLGVAIGLATIAASWQFDRSLWTF